MIQIKHVRKDGSVVADIKGTVIRAQDFPTLYKSLIKRGVNRGNNV